MGWAVDDQIRIDNPRAAGLSNPGFAGKFCQKIESEDEVAKLLAAANAMHPPALSYRAGGDA